MPNPKRTKLRHKTQKGVFIGYAEHSKTYRFLIISSVDKESITESREVVFFESVYPYKQRIIRINVNSSDMESVITHCEI